MPQIAMTVNPTTRSAQEPMSSLLTLLTSSDPGSVEALRSLLNQHPEALEQSECFASKSDLKHLTQAALQQSYSQMFTPDEKLQLLDMAWKIQELLWAEG
jgi:hypothetical protein